MRRPATKPFAVCVNNRGYQASLILGKVYRVLPDAAAARESMIRVVDESGEDYLSDRSHFALVDFPPSVRKQLHALQRAG